MSTDPPSPYLQDAWRGTKLLGSDVAAALGLLQRGARGQSLSAREQRFLKRTLTDVASVIPIGIVMLLPITAVGHAFFLAMLQKYAPGLVRRIRCSFSNLLSI